MNNEKLEKALQSAECLTGLINDAHSDAITSANKFAEIAIFDLIHEAVKLEKKLKRLVDAASE